MKPTRIVLVVAAIALCQSCSPQTGINPQKSTLTAATPKPASQTIAVGDPAVVMSAPEGWSQRIDEPPTERSLTLSCESSLITINLQLLSEIRGEESDSRRLRLYARRYAQGRNLPLTEQISGSTQLWETQTLREGNPVHIISVASESAEAQITAFAPKEAIAEAKKAIDMLLATARLQDSEKLLFPMELPLSAKGQGKPVQLEKAQLIENIGGYKISLPQGWYPDDFLMEGAAYHIDLSSDSVESLLRIRKRSSDKEASGSITFVWFAAKDGERFWEHHQKIQEVIRKDREGEKIFSYLPLADRSPIAVMPDPSKADAESESQIVRYLYASDKLAVITTLVTRREVSLRHFDSVVSNVMEQIMEQI